MKNEKSGMMLNECLEALGLVLEYNNEDHPLHQHALRVGEGCVMIGQKIGMNPKILQRMYYAGILHDIGKISIDPQLLGKKGKLTDKDFKTIEQHSVNGSRILSPLPGMSKLALWVRWHHEKLDGSGYPDGLLKNEIPIEVQVLSAIDCFDSLQTPRVDRDRYDQEEAFNIIEQGKGIQFNPDILDLLMEMVEEKTFVPGKSSDEFLRLKEEFIDVPITHYSGLYFEDEGIYPILRIFAQVIDAKHHYTRGHSTRVSIISKYIAEEMNLPPEDIIRADVAGLLHDAGKVSVPTEILDKPGRPTSTEWEKIKGHPGSSFDILSRITTLKDIAEIVSSHHERYDGKGYPNGLKGDEIPIIAQIIALADTYDAITSSRSYREGQPDELAYKITRENLGTQFNPDIGKIFLDTSPKCIKALFDMNEVSI